jgi:hypothetical protein
MISQFETPILFLIFNRPDTTQKVFNQIKLIKPKYLFIAADGPRLKIEDEYEKCLEARSIIHQIDWDCEVKTLFQESNLGCGLAISSAINWFFINVEEGIILEDDCLPHIDFFNFCRKLLNNYRANSQIMQINGFNPFGSYISSNKCFTTIYPRIWGWATWKNRWQNYSYKMNNWPSYISNKTQYLSRYGFIERHIRHHIWKKTKNSLVVDNFASTWDYQWNFTIMMNNGLCIQPESNLIKNIGFSSGTHYSSNENRYSSVQYGHLIQPILFDETLQKSFDRKIHKLYLFDKFKLTR